MEKTPKPYPLKVQLNSLLVSIATLKAFPETGCTLELVCKYIYINVKSFFLYVKFHKDYSLIRSLLRHTYLSVTCVWFIEVKPMFWLLLLATKVPLILTLKK